MRPDPLKSSMLNPTLELWNSAIVLNMTFSIHMITIKKQQQQQQKCDNLCPFPNADTTVICYIAVG